MSKPDWGTKLYNEALHMAPHTLQHLQRSADRISKCRDKCVGVRLYGYDYSTDDGFIRLSSGFNLRSPLCDDNCSASESDQRCMAIHAEIQAITNLIHAVHPMQPWLCLSTLEPCAHCAKALMSTGVTMVIFGQYTSEANSGLSTWLAHRPNQRHMWVKAEC